GRIGRGPCGKPARATRPGLFLQTGAASGTGSSSQFDGAAIRMKKTHLTVLFLLAGIVIHAAPLTVAVYDFTDTDKKAGAMGAKVTALVTADLAADTNFVMLERAELNKALSEQAFGVSGMVSSDAAAKIGQITGAKVLVAGQVIKTDGNHLVVVANI